MRKKIKKFAIEIGIFSSVSKRCQVIYWVCEYDYLIDFHVICKLLVVSKVDVVLCVPKIDNRQCLEESTVLQ